VTGTIGYYVHHHGEGHRQRALALAERAPDRFVLLGTGLAGRTGAVSAIDLPDDRLVTGAFDGVDAEPERPRALHYAPLRHGGVRARMTAIANWIVSASPSLLVADVSVEVAMLARLCAVPVAYVRLGGHRDDVPHLEAFRGASLLIAPFAEALDDPTTAPWIKRKTIYAPGIVRHRVHGTSDPKTVLVVCGRGGSRLSEADLIAAARSMPDHRWRVIGRTNEATELPSNLTFAGWTNDPETDIAQAGIVIGGAGDGVVGAVLAARRPFMAIPEQRPFDEQVQKARALQHAGAAVALEKWPEAGQWDAVFASARRLDPAHQAALDDPDGASRLTCRLIALADQK
jgi:hypothetical protein